jgi:hypothetical protein
MLALLLCAAVCVADAAEDDGDALVFIQAHYENRAQLQAIASRFQHLIVDERTRTVRVEASHDDLIALRRAGIRAGIDEEATARLRQSEEELQRQAIAGYPCYRTVEETYATMNALAAARPNLARIVDIGPSWLRQGNPDAGYRMRVLRISNSATNARIPDKPDMVVFASIHAREYTPAELLTRFGEWLVEGYGQNSDATWLLDNFRFHLVLHANPDGRKKAEAGLSWRKNVNTSNGTCSANAYGIDLNRNFPYRWNNGGGGSSGNPCAGTYRGPQRMSEPETANLLRYVAGTRGDDGVYRGGVLPDRRGDGANIAAPDDYRGLFIDLHSYSRLVLWPWSYTSTPTSNAAALRALGRRMAWFNGYSPRQWTGLYIADGTTTDTMYGLLGAPSYTIELGHAFFESCSTFRNTTLPRNMAALKYAARSLRAPYLAPSGPVTSAISASPARVDRGTPVRISATIDDSLFNHGNGSEPVQRIASSRAYRNEQPWTPGAMAIAMNAGDGAFDESTENVNATIDTTGLAIGRHTVVVRGTDASGRAGTPKAAHFTVAGSRSFANNTDRQIRDHGTLESAISVAGVAGTAPATVRIGVDIKHTAIGDLDVSLIAPGGTLYRLHRRSGGTNDNIDYTYTRDASSESANGTWRLRVADSVTGNIGYLDGWRLVLHY